MTFFWGVIYVLFDQKQISTAKYISSAYKMSNRNIFKDSIILSYNKFCGKCFNNKESSSLEISV
jgi:hypothetical protein